MQLQEGQIYEGPVSAFGGEGPPQRWLVVAPFGKKHCHSVGDPMDLHCMPLAIAQEAVEEGRLKLVSESEDHPALRLQRTKERLGIHDAHMGLRGASLDRMIELLEQAARAGEDFAPYAAGEVLALVCRLHSAEQIEAIREQVHAILSGTPEGTGPRPGSAPPLHFPA